MKAIAVLSLALGLSMVARGESITDLELRAQDAAQVLRANARLTDTAIPRSLLAHAVCIGTFPNVVRAGFIFGAQGGQGLISCRTARGWSNPAFFVVAGASWGLQIGADATDTVMVFVNRNAVRKIGQTKLTLGTDASVAAGPVGRDAAVGTDFTLQSEIYSYSRSRGIYAGLTLDGAILTPDNDANMMLYGPYVRVQNILYRPAVMSAAVRPYIEALQSL